MRSSTQQKQRIHYGSIERHDIFKCNFHKRHEQRREK